MARDPITTEEGSGVQPPRSGEIDARMPALPCARVICPLIGASFRRAGSPDGARWAARGAPDTPPRGSVLGTSGGGAKNRWVAIG